jgi:hypothetical protein
MESRHQIRQKEIETTKNYSIRAIKANIAFYSFFRFLYSDIFTFVFIFIPLFFIAKYYDFNFKVTLGLILVHPVIYYLNKPINKFLKIDEYDEELKILIEVNKEILKQKKETK